HSGLCAVNPEVPADAPEGTIKSIGCPFPRTVSSSPPGPQLPVPVPICGFAPIAHLSLALVVPVGFSVGTKPVPPSLVTVPDREALLKFRLVEIVVSENVRPLIPCAIVEIVGYVPELRRLMSSIFNTQPPLAPQVCDGALERKI